MSKASEKVLNDLHTKLAEVLKDALADKHDPETGDKLPPNAAILNVARQFLKDNKIEAGLTNSDSAIGSLADLPVFDDDENVVPFRASK